MTTLDLLPQLSAVALELPRAVSPALAAAVVGAICGVLAFVVVLLLLGRRARRVTQQQSLVRIAPYVTFADPTRTSSLPPLRAMLPSSELSARAFAKMDYADSDPEIEIVAELDVDADFAAADEDLADPADASPAPPPAVAVSPVVILSGPPSDATGTGPHPASVIPASSSAMRSASLADFEVDDSPTEIAETFFDEPPKPMARTARPQIRAVLPSPPRFDATPALPLGTPTPVTPGTRIDRHP
jgi:hypothetical protein